MGQFFLLNVHGPVKAMALLLPDLATVRHRSDTGHRQGNNGIYFL